MSNPSVQAAMPVDGNNTPAKPLPGASIKLKLKDIFSVPLVDLESENKKFSGILTPQPEIGCQKVGVSESLLSGAEEYFSWVKQYDYIFSLLQKAFERFPAPPSGIALDIGSGFGNTVIPLLENFPELSVVATDISPDLLAILRREAASRGFEERCACVAMDAHGDYFEPETANNAFGCAVLHHMIDPLKVVGNVLKALAPGGRAVFFEPFETGNSIMRIAYMQILEEAKRRQANGPALKFLQAINDDIEVRTHRRPLPGGCAWEALDDKWLFTRTHFERIAEALNVSDLYIENLHRAPDAFSNQTRQTLVNYGKLDPEFLPQWGWDILRQYDEEFFSAEQKRDLIMEGMVLFVR